MSDRDGYLKRRDQLLMQDEQIAELEARIEELRKLVERTCGDGCHCKEENNEQCALTALEEKP